MYDVYLWIHIYVTHVDGAHEQGNLRCTRRVTHVNAACHTCKYVMSRIWVNRTSEGVLLRCGCGCGCVARESHSTLNPLGSMGSGECVY